MIYAKLLLGNTRTGNEISQVDFGYFYQGAHLAADFVNTKSWLSGKERLTRHDKVRELLRAAGQERPVAKIDLPKLHALRERVRSVFAAPDDAEARRQIAALLADYPAQLGLTAGEHGLTFTPTGSDAESWLGATIAVGLAFFVAEHGTTRFGICGASDCADAFIDASKNHTKHYCSASCTRLENVRAFRTRKRKAP